MTDARIAVLPASSLPIRPQCRHLDGSDDQPAGAYHQPQQPPSEYPPPQRQRRLFLEQHRHLTRDVPFFCGRRSNGKKKIAQYFYGKSYNPHVACWTTTTCSKKTGNQGLITVNYGYARYLSANPVATAAHLGSRSPSILCGRGHTEPNRLPGCRHDGICASGP